MSVSIDIIESYTHIPKPHLNDALKAMKKIRKEIGWSGIFTELEKAKTLTDYFLAMGQDFDEDEDGISHCHINGSYFGDSERLMMETLSPFMTYDSFILFWLLGEGLIRWQFGKEKMEEFHVIGYIYQKTSK